MATTTNVQITDLPTWMQQPLQNLFGASQELTSQPYTPYQGDRLQPFTTDQQTAFQSIRDQAFSGLPYAQAGGETLGAGISALGSAYPFLGAGGTTLAGSIMDLLQASNLFGGAGAGLGTASDAISGSMRGLPGSDISAYMSPFIKQALDPAAQELTRRFEGQQSQLGAQGAMNNAFGGSRQALLEGANQRNYLEGIGDLYSTGFQNAYTSGVDTLMADLNRQLSGGQALGGLSQIAGQLGSGFGGLADVRSRLAGTYGGLAGTAGNLSTILGNLGSQQGDLGALLQNLGLSGSQSLLSSGQQQQAFGQAGLDMSYQDFLNQQQWPYSQLSFMRSILSGAPQIGTISSTGTSPDPDSTSQWLGAGLGGLSLLDSIFGG